MKKASRIQMVVPVLILVALVTVTMVPSQSHASRMFVTGSADIRVWVEESSDVFSSYHDVVVSFRPDRDCYATMFVVDTNGFVHVVYPFSACDRAWVRGGVTYRHSAYELGLDMLHGAGIAYVVAVGSPRPFDYSRWGDDIFVGRFGYRVSGDPYLASRELYLSFLPRHIIPAQVGVSVARFYVGQWVRYPSYLCHGPGVHVRIGDYCRSCSHSYDNFRAHMSAPDVAIHPPVKFKRSGHVSQIRKSTARTRDVASRIGSSRNVTVTRTSATTKTRVVSTSRSVSESRRAYKRDFKKKTERVTGKVAGTQDVSRVSAKQQRVTKQRASASSRKPTSIKRTAETKDVSKRTEEGTTREARKKAR